MQNPSPNDRFHPVAKGPVKNPSANMENIKSVHENINPVTKSGLPQSRPQPRPRSSATSLRSIKTAGTTDDSFSSISSSKTSIAANRHLRAHHKERHPLDKSAMFNVSSDDFLVRINNFDGVLWRDRMQNYFKDFFQWPPKTFLGLFWTTGYYQDWAEDKKEGYASLKEHQAQKMRENENNQVSGSKSRSRMNKAPGYKRADGDPEHLHHHMVKTNPQRDKEMRQLIFKTSQIETAINPKNPKFIKSLRTLGPQYDTLQEPEVVEFLLKIARDPNWKPTSSQSLFSSTTSSTSTVGSTGTASISTKRASTSKAKHDTWSEIVDATHKPGSRRSALGTAASTTENTASHTATTPETKPTVNGPKAGKSYAKVSPAVPGFNKLGGGRK